MRTFSKSSKLDNVCYDIRGPVMDEANEMIAKGEKIFKLNIGNPAPFGFSAPDEVIEDMMRGGAALVVAGLCADGMPEVANRYFIDRGYEDICRDLSQLGADIDSW